MRFRTLVYYRPVLRYNIRVKNYFYDFNRKENDINDTTTYQYGDAIKDAAEIINDFSDDRVREIGFLNYGIRNIHREHLIHILANKFYNKLTKMGV